MLNHFGKDLIGLCQGVGANTIFTNQNLFEWKMYVKGTTLCIQTSQTKSHDKRVIFTFLDHEFAGRKWLKTDSGRSLSILSTAANIDRERTSCYLCHHVTCGVTHKSDTLRNPGNATFALFQLVQFLALIVSLIAIYNKTLYLRYPVFRHVKRFLSDKAPLFPLKILPKSHKYTFWNYFKIYSLLPFLNLKKWRLDHFFFLDLSRELSS